MKNKNYLGFSLVELMISLIIISLVAAAFAPVITKKLKASTIISGDMASEISDQCEEKFGSDCKLCTKSYCVQCSKSCDNTTFSETKTCSCKSCSLKFSNCENCTSEKCTKCAFDYYIKDNKCEKCEKGKFCNGESMLGECPSGCYCDEKGRHLCNEKFSNCMACTKNKCTSCFDRYGFSNGKCQTCSSKYGSECVSCNANECTSCKQGYNLNSSNQCEKNDTNQFKCSDSNFMKIGNLCFTRINMGDSAMLPIPFSVVTVEANKEYCYSKSQKCCYKGNTSPSCSDTNGDYSGCTRTVCNLSAAQEICKNFSLDGGGWRLPTRDEIEVALKTATVGLGNEGMQICGGEGTYFDGKITRCGIYWGGCYGASSYCSPDKNWTSEECNAYDQWTGLYAYQTLSFWNTSKAAAISVRCVKEPSE